MGSQKKKKTRMDEMNFADIREDLKHFISVINNEIEIGYVEDEKEPPSQMIISLRKHGLELRDKLEEIVQESEDHEDFHLMIRDRLSSIVKEMEIQGPTYVRSDNYDFEWGREHARGAIYFELKTILNTVYIKYLTKLCTKDGK